MNNNGIILEGRNLCIGYRKRKQNTVIHQQLNFTLRKGELTCLLGKNGAGKSTLLRTISGTQPPLSGQLTLNGKPLHYYNETQRAKYIGIVLTDRTQTGGLTVRELVALGRQPHTGFFGRLSEKDRLLIANAMKATGIEHKANQYMAELSDGERQKAMIAKALVQECPIILLDEPTAFLDVVSRIEIMTLLHRLAVTENKAILLSTHDIELALMLSDRLWTLTDSYGLESGYTEDMVLNGRMDALFATDNINFNMLRGGYMPNSDTNHCICLETHNAVLSRWAKNALTRYGIGCCEKKYNNNNIPKLTVKAKNCITWLDTSNTETNIYSFEELADVLKAWLRKPNPY